MLGCWFHFDQAVLKRAMYLRLTGISASMDLAVQKAMALPLLPENRMAEGIDHVEEMMVEASTETSHRAAVTGFLKYLRTFWLPRSISVYGADSRTNNFAESFHSRLKRLIMVPHPNMWVFLEHIRTVNHSKTMDVRRLQLGFEEKLQVNDELQKRNQLIADAQNELADVRTFLDKVWFTMSHIFKKNVRIAAAAATTAAAEPASPRPVATNTPVRAIKRRCIWSATSSPSVEKAVRLGVEWSPDHGQSPRRSRVAMLQADEPVFRSAAIAALNEVANDNATPQPASTGSGSVASGSSASASSTTWSGST